MSKIKNQNYSSRIKSFRLLVLGLIICILSLTIFPTITKAIVDPLEVANNKFGIHIISATPQEASSAAEMVNSSGGDWGYITVLIENKDRNHDKWQTFFNDLRARHLIPIVRIATAPEGNFWKLPYDGEENAWADFLNSLIWPTQNRYVVIYNEPNQGQEWGGKVDARSYAHVLDKTITALKNKSPDFFVLNAGFDASAPKKVPLFEDEPNFLQEMNQEVPGIFNKLDGWVSHSYPNPGFAGSPDDNGRGTVRTWAWELGVLKGMGVTKNLPVFITETGWKHAEGLIYDKSFPSADTVGDYLQEAFKSAWNDNRIVAVTPFLLNYQESPFDHFSFKKITGEEQNLKILGASYPDYYPSFQSIIDLGKIVGKPVQDNLAQLTGGSIYPSLVTGESYIIPLIFKNIGQSIWNENDQVQLRAIQGQSELNIDPVQLTTSKKITPGQETVFNLHLTAPKPGTYKINLQLYHGDKAFDQPTFEFSTEVKSPVILDISSSLLWKKNPSGKYLLTTDSNINSTSTWIDLDEAGKSGQLEAKYLLPDYNFKFTLYKPFYKPKTIEMKVVSGINHLGFGMLEPDFWSALLHPLELWKLLPFSN
ncbi:MAG: hypothetical protein M1142_02290 [Patescibacteria group bacterium]|nr:hypothetical protein [Patescibacteria group bacterium]